MEYINKPVCDSCGGLKFKTENIEKPEPEVRYVQASQYYKPVDWSSCSTGTLTLGPPELTKKAICVKCGKEYLH